MKPYVKFSLSVLALGILALGLAVGARAGTDFSPRLRVAHAAIGAPAADMYVDNDLVFQNIPYRTVAGYKVATAGSHRLRVFPTGTNPQQPATLENGYAFGNNQDYTLVALGQVNNLELRSFMDDNTVPNAGQTRVRVIHASPNLPAVNICITGQEQCLVNTLAFKNASSYIMAGAGTYNLEVRQADNKNVLWTAPGMKFDDSVIYTLFIMGLWQGNPGAEFIRSTDAIRPPPQPPQTGAFLSPEALAVVAAAGITLLAGIGLLGWWLARRRVI